MSDRNILYLAIGTGACLLAGVVIYKFMKPGFINMNMLGVSKVHKRNNPILGYIYENSVTPREDENLANLRVATLAHPLNRMSTPPEQTQFLGFLASLIGAKKAIDIGVYTGLSALAVALVLPVDGTLIACDITEEFPLIGKPYWEKAGVNNMIDLRINNAVDTLQELIKDDAETFDFIFLDADKRNYSQYVDLSYQLLRKGGLMVIDNVLWSGKVLDASTADEDTISIRNVNIKLRDDTRFNISMLPIADGVTLLTKL
ncbi:Catechol O-methyltransferase domain-containing protein 1 isoform X1 [Oopsacas minuta]|uniref:Catechol O-methyltransferase domain-containing protein 1 isoform X1 n=1 Tax=Oopsacas minuta TaxID=111878 RepID=A0AAV7KJL1_9METZ|nr:Catechol O-methyltransferase domain-containing protein 1 isoform X1 [Oopsacas minuta]